MNYDGLSNRFGVGQQYMKCGSALTKIMRIPLILPSVLLNTVLIKRAITSL